MEANTGKKEKKRSHWSRMEEKGEVDKEFCVDMCNKTFLSRKIKKVLLLILFSSTINKPNKNYRTEL